MLKDEQAAPGSHRLRKGRVSLAGQIYLLTMVTQHRRPLFHRYPLARTVVLAMKHRHDARQLHSMAFVLMPDHLHWLVALGDTVPLAKMMASFKGVTAKRINALAGMSGNVWQAGYHDHALRREEDALQAARYIVANPLRAGLVERIGDYPHWDAEWL